MARTPSPSLLRVDLSAGTVEREPLPERWVRGYIGGKGLGARYLYDRQAPGTDPLGRDNHLLLLTGPLTGYLPGDPRFAAVTRSPLTGAFLDSYGGGRFAAGLAAATGPALGVALVGRADEPVVLELADGGGRLRPAGDLWGKDVVETTAALDGAVACVGPAGEHAVRFATVATDAGDHHAGRGGAGAVMGDKRLKAVVTPAERPAVPPALADLRSAYERRYHEHDVGRWRDAGGTVESLDFAAEVGALPTRGWQSGTFEGADDIGVQAAREAAVDRERSGDLAGDFHVETPGGEALLRGGSGMSLGAGLGIDDFDAVAALGERCDRLGLDVVGAASAVAWAVRAVEAGDLETDRDLAFGDPEAARRLVDAIAARDPGLGDTLADGVARAAATHGGQDLVPTVKGMAVPAYDPRASPATALAYATSDRGACHRRSLPVEVEAFADDSWDDAARVAVVTDDQTATAVLWSLIADDFAGAALREDLGDEWLAALDHPAAGTDLRAVGERVWTLTRLFNVREGIRRDDDGLPAAFTRPVPDGPSAGRSLDPDRFDRLLTRYYAARGWSADGVPARPLLERLDLVDVVDDATPVADAPAELPDAVGADAGD